MHVLSLCDHSKGVILYKTVPITSEIHIQNTLFRYASLTPGSEEHSQSHNRMKLRKTDQSLILL